MLGLVFVFIFTYQHIHIFMDVDDVGVAAEQRAADLIDRLADCGLDEGLNEEDLFGKDVREPFRTLCGRLAGKTLALAEHSASDFHRLRGAVTAVEKNIETEDASRGGRLDRSLTRVARSLNKNSKTNQRIDVLEELVQFVQASLVIASFQQQEPATTTTPMEIEGDSVEKSVVIRRIAGLLDVECSKKCEETLENCYGKLDTALKDLPKSFTSPLLKEETFNDEQTRLLQEVNEALFSEYRIRRQTLSKRASVTLQSLQHSNRIKKEQSKEVKKVIDKGLSSMKDDPAVSFGDLFTATQADLQAFQAKVTKDGQTSFETSVKSVIIGKVPDRGGRVTDQRTGGGNMPEWAPRKSSGGQGKSQGGGKKHKGGGNWGKGKHGKGR